MRTACIQFPYREIHSAPTRSYAPTLVKRISPDLRGLRMVEPLARTFADAALKIGTVEIEICLRNIVSEIASPPSERR